MQVRWKKNSGRCCKDNKVSRKRTKLLVYKPGGKGFANALCLFFFPPSARRVGGCSGNFFYELLANLKIGYYFYPTSFENPACSNPSLPNSLETYCRFLFFTGFFFPMLCEVPSPCLRNPPRFPNVTVFIYCLVPPAKYPDLMR